MKSTEIIDLEVLALKCRNEQSRAYIAEAVACYRSGALRACIVSTWIAVSFDYIDKMHLLRDDGDLEAASICKTLDSIRDPATERSAALKRSLEFERSILSDAHQKFEFLSSIEYEDLERLYKDRHRCAHPSMNRDEDFYQPSAEQARAHMRNAVFHMLQHPPTQGRKALQRVWEDTLLDSFPTKGHATRDYW